MGLRWVLGLLLALPFLGSAKALVKEVASKNELDRILNYHALTGLPVVIDFYSTTCGPCRQIEPVYKQMAGEFKDKAVFLKVNVQTSDAAQGIRSMPTFRFYFRGKKVHEFSGGDPGQIKSTLNKYHNKAKNHNPMKIREIANKGELKKLFRDALKMPVLVGFVSKEDEGCKAVWPTVKQINKDYNGKVVVAKVLVDDHEDVVAMCNAQGVPSFQIYVSGKKIDESNGPDNELLQNMVIRASEEFAKTQSSSSSSKKEKSKKEERAPATPKRTAKRPQRRSPSRIVRAAKYPEKVVIIGAGPGGLAAATYAARAGLKPVLIAPDHGGQLTYTKEVENYPGLPDATGEGLIEALRFQAESFDTQFESTVVTHIDLSVRPFVITTNQTDLSEGMNIINTHTIIVATGSNSLWLEVPGEDLFRTKGISTCATCDGFLFKGKAVLVVGGGDSAMEEALFLARIASSVTLIHRRSEFRASYILQERVKSSKHIKIIWDTEVAEFKGNSTDGYLTHAVLKNKLTGDTTELAVDATFIAIGHTPNTALFKDKLAMDEGGFLTTQPGNTHTTVEGVFACGDVADNVYRQAVTSAGTGAMAAIDAERYIDEQGLDTGEAQEDYTTWSVKELKAAMKEKGISAKGCFEKTDFIKKLQHEEL